jgi:hypothetical protein
VCVLACVEHVHVVVHGLAGEVDAAQDDEAAAIGQQARRVATAGARGRDTASTLKDRETREQVRAGGRG